MMSALLKKDFRNACQAFGPALLLGVALLLILQLTQSSDSALRLPWRSAFWLTFFFSSTSLFFRSFGLEHRFKNFHVYTAFQVSRSKIFWSQTLVQMATSTALGAAYLLLVTVFWTPSDLDWLAMIEIILLISAGLSPLGILLGLMLQREREFLFSVLYLPLATPLILGAHETSNEIASSWLYLLVSFTFVSGFLSAFLFEFFFDELSQS